jgi:hypothetical protein
MTSSPQVFAQNLEFGNRKFILRHSAISRRGAITRRPQRVTTPVGDGIGEATSAEAACDAVDRLVDEASGRDAAMGEAATAGRAEELMPGETAAAGGEGLGRR